MATESEAGGKLPPGVGIITKDVVKTRPDLSDMEGFTVRVPRSLDIEANDGPQRVWVQGPEDSVMEGKPVTFPTIVLSAAELLAVYRGDGGSGKDVDEARGADSGLSKTKTLHVEYATVAAVDASNWIGSPSQSVGYWSE